MGKNDFLLWKHPLAENKFLKICLISLHLNINRLINIIKT